MGTDFPSTGAALVVGASGGIGADIARLLAERGSAVALTWRSGSEAAAATLADVTAYAAGSSHRLDVTSADEAARVVADVVAAHGGLHTVVHAAGPHVPMVHLSRVAPEQMARQLQQDTLGFFTVVHAALPALRESGGSIVAVTTAATARFPKRDGLSSGPKAAVEAMVRGLAAEEGRFGVRANAVGPGMLTDGMAERLIGGGDLSEEALEITRGNIPLGRFGRARDIAEAVCFLASTRAGFISGQKLDVDGGYGV
ncbi:SDR family NAD(P)-dependent oxidoreductase [Nocardioides daejeonensis]|uniref:SDR family NAD(P)-dependent oxidoreductase n=1 Tax=Nocardioides daejeonensis TaxID=1046556 RepID=UPI000D74BB7B|nr:SDR family oxidoreductase [Nocardioides daejeonensis]